MIIVDYSQIALASIIVQRIDDPELIRHICLNTLRMYNKKYREEYGQMVLACDGFNSWRKQFFPEYKGNRKKNRSASELDWNLIFGTLNDLREEIKDNFPWKVLHLDECEADDIIATLTMQTQEFGLHEPVMIISSDKDFIQLQKFNNVKQFSPATKKLVTDPNPRLYKWNHVCRGDSGDGVPNSLSDDDCFVVEGKRQKPLTKKALARMHDAFLRGDLPPENRPFIERNEKLVDLQMKMQKLKEVPSNAPKNVTNALFVGSTSELQKMLKGK